MSEPSTADIARQTLDIIPLVMQVMASEMRTTRQQMASSHLRLLGMLSFRPYTLTELAEQLSVTPATMSNTITAMEKRGWVTRTRSSEDRRVVLMSLTPTGAEALEDVQEQTRKRIGELLAGLPPSERHTLAEGLSILKRTFEAGLAR
jgi:DNA-binding MarR family transcriptional regulator